MLGSVGNTLTNRCLVAEGHESGASRLSGSARSDLHNKQHGSLLVAVCCQQKIKNQSERCRRSILCTVAHVRRAPPPPHSPPFLFVALIGMFSSNRFLASLICSRDRCPALCAAQCTRCICVSFKCLNDPFFVLFFFFFLGGGTNSELFRTHKLLIKLEL